MKKWHRRMLNMAVEAASWSKDPNTHVGAVIFRDRQVVSTGFNGFPRGVEDASHRLHDRDVKRRFTKHAEENAILCAADRGAATHGAHIIVTAHPCAGCMGSIIQAGIKRVICPYPWNDDEDIYSFGIAQIMAEEARVELVYFDADSIVPERGE